MQLANAYMSSYQGPHEPRVHPLGGGGRQKTLFLYANSTVNFMTYLKSMKKLDML